MKNSNSFYNELTKNLTQWEKTASISVPPEVSATNAPETQTAKETTQTPKTKVAEVLRELVKIAEELDNNGSTKAADLVDATIKALSENNTKE